MRTLVVSVVVVLGCVLVGCTSGGGSSDDFPLTEQEIQIELDAAGDSQRPMLEDGTVTPAERERAYLNFVSCAAEKGVEIYDFSLSPFGGDSFNSRIVGANVNEGSNLPDEPNGENEDGPQAQPVGLEEQVIDECRAEHYVAVGLLFTYQNRRTGQELIDFESAVAQCMRDRGAEVPIGASEEQMSQIDRNLNNQCWLENGGS